MNIYCTKRCKHIEICKLNEEQTRQCKYDIEYAGDSMIFGMTFDEILKLQQRGGGKRKDR